jgi:translocation and assembly module TamB
MTKRKTTLISVAAIIACLLLIGITAVVVVQTDWFRNYVRQKIISSTEDATGGKVEIRSFSFDVRHLRAVITDFVIHGKEPAGSAPLLKAARVEVDFRLFTSLRHLLDVTYLGVAKPSANVMTFADGTTNLPNPRQKNDTTALESVLNLAVGHFDLSDGLLTLNAQPEQFSLSGNNLRAELWFNILSRSYSGQLGMEPIYVVSGRNTPVRFRLTLPVTLERDRITLKNATVTSDASNIGIDGSLENLRNPKVTAHLKGHIGLADMKNVANLSLILKGRNTPASMDLDATAHASGDAIEVTGLRLSLGHSTLEASGPFKDPKGTGGLQFKAELALGEIGRLADISLRPEGRAALNGTARIDAANRYDVTGNLEARNVSFYQGKQRISNIRLNSSLAATPDLVTLKSLRLDWLGGEFRGDASLQDLAKYQLTGELSRLDIRAAARAFGQDQLPYDGVVSGRVAASGDVNAKGTRGITAQTRLTISPARTGIPVSGRLDANYNGTADTVAVANSVLELPHTRLTLNGSLNNHLNITLTSRDLNDLLTAASPPAKSPVVFQGGQAVFTGTVVGHLSNPRISGHINVNRFAVQGRQFQSLDTDVIASSSQAAVSNGTLTRISTQAQFSGSVGLVNWKPLPNDPVAADASINSSDLGDLAVLAGQSSSRYSGSVKATAHLDGTVGNPRGLINMQAANGLLYGNSFDQASLQVNLADQLITVPGAYITSGASRIDLTGDFQHPRDNLTTGQVHAHLQSNPVDLSQVRLVQQKLPNSGALVQFNADLAGSLSAVNQQSEFQLSRLSTDISAKSVKLDGQTYGDLTATARTNGSNVTYHVTSNLAGSNLEVMGNTQLIRDYPSTADAKLSRLPIERLLILARQPNIRARGDLSGTVHVAGTIANPIGNVDLDLTNAVIYDEPLDRVHATATYMANAIDLSHLEAIDGAGRIVLSGRFDHPSNDLKSGNVQFKIDSTRVDLAKLRGIQKLRPGLGGALKLSANGSGTLRPGNPTIQFSSLNADVAATGLALQKAVLGDITLKADTASGNRLTFALSSNLAGSNISGQGNAQLSGDYPVDVRLNVNKLTWARLEPLLGPNTGELPAFDAATDGVLTVSGPAMKTDQLHGTLQLTRLTLDTHFRTGLTKSVGFRNQGPIALSLDQGTVRITSAHITGPETDVQASGTASLTQQTLNLSLNANVNLALLQSLDQDIVSSGGIAANASVRGSFASPQITGQIQLQKASVNYAGFPNGISNANGTIALNGTNATLRNVEGESGGGRVTLTGFVAFPDQLRFGLRAHASQVRVRIQEGVSVVGDGDMRLSGTTASSSISGSVTVTQLSYAVKSDIGSILSRSNSPVESAEAPSPLLDNMKLDIRIETSTSLGVQASLAQNLDATADLHVRGTVSQPGVLGRITITEGQLVFFGSTYTVNSGSIGFYNPLRIEPILNVNLETQAQGVDVVLTVTGPIDNMKLTYTSDPPLQFQEIVALLAAGKTPTSDPTLLANQPSQPAQSYAQMGESAIVGKALADPVTNRLQRVFGITQLKVDPAFVSGTQVPTARLTVQQQISTNVTFTYTTALDDANSTIIRAEWSFSPRYSAVATRDQNGIISVLLFYKRSFR